MTATADRTAGVTASPASAKVVRSQRVRNRNGWAHGLLIIATLTMIFPFYFTFVLASRTNADFYASPPKLLPGTQFLSNVRQVLSSIDFFGSMLNTVIVAVSVTVLVLLFDSLAAFAFAKYDFPAKRALFGLLLLFFMLPAQLSAVPQFITMIHIGWAGTLKALIVPAAANAFGIFWMRQYISGAVPDELLDAATIDGCGFFRQYAYVALPIIKPGLGFLGIYTFVGAWNDFVWPLIVLTNPGHLTLQVALAQLNNVHGNDHNIVMAGSFLAIVPLLIAFLVFARQFVADAVAGAVRG
jgi:cellobiose transport system permease protein